MSNGRLHQQLEWAFAAITRAPSPRLTERIRQSLWGRPPPATSTEFPLPAAAALVAALVLIALLTAAFLEAPALAQGMSSLRHQLASLKNPFNPPAVVISPGPTSQAGRTPTVSPTLQATPVPSPTAAAGPAATPVPPGAPAAPPLAGYSCSSQSGGGGGQTGVASARTGPHPGFDRFVLEFNGGVAQFTVQPQGDANFLPSGGGSVGLQGSAGLLVTLQGASSAGSFSGTTDIAPGLPAIREAKLLTDSGGVVQWGIGLARQDCFHVFTLAGPNRLVIDVQD